MHFLSINDLSKEHIDQIFSIADKLKNEKTEMGFREESVSCLFFERPSLRTRVSFEKAVVELGGHAIYLDANDSHLSRGESYADLAKMLSLYVDFIITRLYKHENLLEIANNSRVPVINALTELEHPTQALTDLYTIREKLGMLRGIKLAFLGDITASTANSLMLAGVKMGMEIALIGPKNYMPNTIYFTKAREYGIAKTYNDTQEGVRGADVLYTDEYISMTFTGSEKEAEEKKRLLLPYQLNSKVLGMTKKNAVVMHSLPAHRGEEITADVIDGSQSIVIEQARNKLYVEEAILLFLSEKSL